MQDYSFHSLMPAIVTIIVSVATHNVIAALALGIFSGVIVISGANAAIIFEKTFHYIEATFADAERIEISIFVMLIGGLLEIMSASGAYYMLADTLSRKLDTAVKSRLATWLIGIFIFFDDYANVLIAGSSMRKINFINRVSIAQAGYIVDIVSEIASVAIISTWAAYEGSLMLEASLKFGLKKSSMELLIASLPYHFYTYLGIIFTFLTAYSGKWLGTRFERPDAETKTIIDAKKEKSPEYQAKNLIEIKAKKTNTINVINEINAVTGSLHNDEFITETERSNDKDGMDKCVRTHHFLVPILSLIAIAFGGLFISGYFLLRRDGNEPATLINILSKSPTIEVLLFSAIAATILCVYLMKKDGVLAGKSYFKIFLIGKFGMSHAALIIMLSNGLAKISNDLGTGQYITGMAGGFVTEAILPAIIFITSMLITVATGFSWSSMAIMMPVAYQMAAAHAGTTLIPVISGAVVTGAISGAHLVPYSDKSVMTAAACKITPIYHVKTQFLNVICAIIASAAGYFIAGMAASYLFGFITATAIIFIIHYLFAE